MGKRYTYRRTQKGLIYSQPKINNPGYPERGPCDPTPEEEPQVVPNEQPIPVTVPVTVPEKATAICRTYLDSPLMLPW